MDTLLLVMGPAASADDVDAALAGLLRSQGTTALRRVLVEVDLSTALGKTYSSAICVDTLRCLAVQVCKYCVSYIINEHVALTIVYYCTFCAFKQQPPYQRVKFSVTAVEASAQSGACEYQVITSTTAPGTLTTVSVECVLPPAVDGVDGVAEHHADVGAVPSVAGAGEQRSEDSPDSALGVGVHASGVFASNSVKGNSPADTHSEVEALRLHSSEVSRKDQPSSPPPVQFSEPASSHMPCRPSPAVLPQVQTAELLCTPSARSCIPLCDLRVDVSRPRSVAGRLSCDCPTSPAEFVQSPSPDSGTVRSPVRRRSQMTSPNGRIARGRLTRGSTSSPAAGADKASVPSFQADDCSAEAATHVTSDEPAPLVPRSAPDQSMVFPAQCDTDGTVNHFASAEEIEQSSTAQMVTVDLEESDEPSFYSALEGAGLSRDETVNATVDFIDFDITAVMVNSNSITSSSIADVSAAAAEQAVVALEMESPPGGSDIRRTVHFALPGNCEADVSQVESPDNRSEYYYSSADLHLSFTRIDETADDFASDHGEREMDSDVDDVGGAGRDCRGGDYGDNGDGVPGGVSFQDISDSLIADSDHECIPPSGAALRVELGVEPADGAQLSKPAKRVKRKVLSATPDDLWNESETSLFLHNLNAEHDRMGGHGNLLSAESAGGERNVLGAGANANAGGGEELWEEGDTSLFMRDLLQNHDRVLAEYDANAVLIDYIRANLTLDRIEENSQLDVTGFICNELRCPNNCDTFDELPAATKEGSTLDTADDVMPKPLEYAAEWCDSPHGTCSAVPLPLADLSTDPSAEVVPPLCAAVLPVQSVAQGNELE